jgi:hypothetical protein
MVVRERRRRPTPAVDVDQEVISRIDDAVSAIRAEGSVALPAAVVETVHELHQRFADGVHAAR